MNKTEFDQFADEYSDLHATNIKVSGETPDFFAEYKVVDTAKHLKNKCINENFRILDFGAGVGNSIPFFLKYFSGAKLVCADVSEKSLNIAQARHPDLAEYTLFNGINLPFKNESFDVVFTACVFHHIAAEEHIGLFKEVLRVLKRNGTFIIFEHNPLNPLTVRAVNTCEFDKNAVLISKQKLKRNLQESGFIQITSRYRIFFPRFMRALRVFEPLIAWLPLGAQYYVAGKKSDHA